MKTRSKRINQNVCEIKQWKTMVFFVECAIALYRENQKNTYLFLIFTEPRPEGLLRNPARWESLQIAHFPGKSKIILTIFKFFKRSWKTYNSQRFFWFFSFSDKTLYKNTNFQNWNRLVKLFNEIIEQIIQIQRINAKLNGPTANPFVFQMISKKVVYNWKWLSMTICNIKP